MDDLELKNLLESADAAVPIARLQVDLSTKVRSRAKRRARTRMVAIVLLLAPLAGLPAYLLREKSRQIVQSEPIRVTTADLKAPILALDEEANFHLRIAQDISRIELARKTKRSVGSSLALTALTADQFSTAAVLLQSADDMRSGRNGRPDAIAQYQNVIRLFPDAPAAVTARQRLRELDNS